MSEAQPSPLPDTPPRSPGQPLPGLPGSTTDAGTGPASIALFAGLLDDAALLAGPLPPTAPDDGEAVPDAVVDAVAVALQQHRDLLTSAAGELLAGPLLVPAGLADAVSLALQPQDHALRLVLVPDPASDAAPATTSTDAVSGQLLALQHARNLFLDDHRVELVGVQVPVPTDLPAAPGTRAVMHALDFTVPAWLRLGARTDWPDALAVLAEDGAEGLALSAGGPHPLPPARLAALLRDAVDRELTVRIVDGPLPWVRPEPAADRPGSATPHGALNVLCAVRAALNGADTDELTGILTATVAAPLLSAVRRMSDADAVVLRAFLAAVPTAPVAGAIDDLASFGLLPPDGG